MGMDSANEPQYLEFTDNYNELLEGFRNLRSRGPFVLNGKAIDAYTTKMQTQPADSVKVGNSCLLPFPQCFGLNMLKVGGAEADHTSILS